MDTHGRRRLTRRDAEQLLRDPSSSRHALGPVLDAARSSQARSDAAREDDAAAAFVAARTASRVGAAAPAAARIRRPVTKALVGSGLAVALASGGVSLAATGHLPDVPLLRDLPTLPDQASDRASEATRSAGSTTTDRPSAADAGTDAESPSSDAESSAGETATGQSATPDGGASGEPGVAPSPDLTGLCRAFQAEGGSTRVLDGPAFGALVDAAGGRGGVVEFCVARTDEDRGQGSGPRGSDQTPKPDRTPRPDKPTGPAKPDKPEDPGKPTDPGKPGGPDKPTDPGKPSGPDKPEDPGKPDDPGKPTGPDKPEDPGNPTGPDQAPAPPQPGTPQEAPEPDKGSGNR